MKRILLALLRIYKIALSPYLGSQCRFLPTCSDYARDAIISHGPARGTWMAACRLCRCHPFAKGGYDPVPEPVVHGNASAVPPAATASGRPSITVRLPRP
jgi:putative membrane protein insertion efficiency factor